MRDLFPQIGTLRRQAGLAATLLKAAATGPQLPFKLTVCLTFRCNHRCAACHIWARDKGREMTAGELDRLFASVPDLAWLDLTGGEVVLRQDLPGILASLRKHNRNLALLHFPTGGMLPDRVEAAARAMVWPGGPRVIVSVSFDGPPALHDRLRGMPGAFDRAAETWHRLRRLPGVQVYPGLTLQPATEAHPGNLDAWRQTADCLAERLEGFTIADLHVNFLHRSPHYFGNPDHPTCPPSQLQQVLAAVQQAKGLPLDPVRAIEAGYLSLCQDHLRHGRSPVPCRSGEVSAYVAPDGTVHPCTIDDRPLGRLQDHDFDLARLWTTEARRALRAEIAADRCPGCWTPCEAYQTLLSQPGATATGLLKQVLGRRGDR